MSEYYFRIPLGKYADVRSQAMDLFDANAARKQALMIWRDLARDVAIELETQPEWRIIVEDGAGKPVIEIRTVVEIAH